MAMELVIDDIISAHSLELSIEAAENNPAMPHDCEDMDHWRCRIVGDGLEGLEFHVSIGKAHAGAAPDLPTVLSLVLADVRSYRECNGYPDFAAMLGVDDGDGEPAIEAAWNELARIDSAIASWQVDPAQVPARP